MVVPRGVHLIAAAREAVRGAAARLSLRWWERWESVCCARSPVDAGAAQALCRPNKHNPGFCFLL